MKEQVLRGPGGQLWWISDEMHLSGFGKTTILVAMSDLKTFETPVRKIWVANTIPQNNSYSSITMLDISEWDIAGKYKKKKTSRVVAQYDWTAVKEVTDPSRQGLAATSYDVWEWNLFKTKWVRLSNSACGFGALLSAKRCADERSKEIVEMFRKNQNPPKPL